MSNYGKVTIEVLAPVVDAARKVLARLDDEEIPNSVQRVAAYSGGRLPPPLARRLVEALDSNAWLRAKVAEELGDDASPAAGFVTRPDGWMAAFLAAVEGAAADGAAGDVRRLEAQVENLKGRVAAAKKKGRALADARAGRRDAAVHEKAQEEKRLRAEVEAAQRRQRDADRLHENLEQRLEAMTQAHADAQRELARMRERARKIRAGRAGSTGAGPGGLTRDPVELAKHLDRLARLAVSREESSVAGGDAEQERFALKLPAGIAPDAAQAVQWLIDRDQPYTLVVDGYNVLFLIDPSDFTSGAARQRLNHGLNRLRRQARSSPRVIVIYDSSLPGEPDVGTAGDVEVRFAAEDRLADEEVVALARASKGPVVVVSTDREVREGSEAVGALPLWSESLVAWMKPAV